MLLGHNRSLSGKHVWRRRNDPYGYQPQMRQEPCHDCLTWGVSPSAFTSVNKQDTTVLSLAKFHKARADHLLLTEWLFLPLARPCMLPAICICFEGTVIPAFHEYLVSLHCLLLKNRFSSGRIRPKNKSCWCWGVSVTTCHILEFLKKCNFCRLPLACWPDNAAHVWASLDEGMSKHVNRPLFLSWGNSFFCGHHELDSRSFSWFFFFFSKNQKIEI